MNFDENIYVVTIVYCSTFLVFIKIKQVRSDLQNKSVFEDLNREKLELLAMEDQVALGSAIQLDDEEKLANDILMSWKHKELDEAFNNPQYFNFSKHYLSYRNDIEKSTVYQIIKRMPKGAALHIHNPFILGIDEIIRFTSTQELYICYKFRDYEEGRFKPEDFVDEVKEEDFDVIYSDKRPTRPCVHGWNTFDEISAFHYNQTKFYKIFKHFFSIHERDPETLINENSDALWNKFETVLRNMKSVTTYWPMTAAYLYQSMRKLYADNVMYAEIRTGLPTLYDLDGSSTDRKFTMDMYRGVINDFKKDYPDFIGMKLIITRDRKHDVAYARNGLEMARTLNETYPGLIAGFDLVGREDKGRPLSRFLPALTEARRVVNYYLHAGETNWNGGTLTHENLFDAVVLKSRRIGHAYGLIKHPSLFQAIIKRNIAIEANVISNNVFGLVKDLRNHPLATYLAVGLPVVLSSDFPGAWGAEPLSHDFFVTFMAIASKHADIRLLKQLALNSIQYSSLNNSEKARCLDSFNSNWKIFIKDLITSPDKIMNFS